MRILQKLVHILWTTFLNGLLTVLPFTLTVALLTFSFRLIYSWFYPIYEIEPQCLRAIPGSHIALVIVGVFLLGAVIRLLFLEPLIHAIERLFAKIPLINQVYGGIKQLVHALGSQDEGTFKKVVMVPFPHQNSLSIGFLTSEVPASILPGPDRYFHVFIPTTPNPTSGFLVQIKESDIRIVDLTRQEAMSLIISGGIIKPERLR